MSSASLVSALVDRGGTLVVLVAFVKGWLMVEMFILVIIVVLLWLGLMMSMSVFMVNCLIIVASLMGSFLVMLLLSPRVRVLCFSLIVSSVVVSVVMSLGEMRMAHFPVVVFVLVAVFVVVVHIVAPVFTLVVIVVMINILHVMVIESLVFGLIL